RSRERARWSTSFFPDYETGSSSLPGRFRAEQMLAIGRAIMGLPKLLLLDEPSSGLAPMIVQHLFEVLGTFKRLGLTIIVAEQNVELGLRYADRGAVLHLGRLAMTAPKVELEQSPEIARLYLG